MTSIIMFGNPGAGKSTILSSIVQQSLFPSGPSINRGKTTKLQRVEHNGVTYIDTPGLSDIMLREHAAQEIESALKAASGKFKVFFVVTLDNGRVRPDDLATMKLILESIPHIKPNQYSIIVNKLSEQLIQTLNTSQSDKEELLNFFSLPFIGSSTSSIFYLPRYQDLVDQTNKWAPANPNLLDFISTAPEIIISSDQVHSIKYTQYEQIMEELREETQHLRDVIEDLRQKMAARDAEINRLTTSNDPPIGHKATGDKQKKLQKKMDEIQNLRKENAELKRAAVDHKVTIGKLNFTLKEQTEEMQKLRKDILRTAVAHQEIVDKLTLKLQERKQENSKLEHDNKILRQNIKPINKDSASKPAWTHTKETIIMIGNPGAGKSTLLTSLVAGQHQFNSGMSIGKGLTAELKVVEYNDKIYIDTPGLSDVKLRQKAADDIEHALRKSGNYKVFFVITLESGRVKPDDMTTIELVLTAAKQIKNNLFSIIINKMSNEVAKMLAESEEDREELAVCLVPPSIGVSTKSIFYVPLNPEWEDKPDQWGPLTPELHDFIAEAPSIGITPKKVKPLKTAKYDAILAKLRAEIDGLKANHAKMEKAIAQRQKKLGGKTPWYLLSSPFQI